jgi:hypothetical protein
MVVYRFVRMAGVYTVDAGRVRLPDDARDAKMFRWIFGYKTRRIDGQGRIEYFFFLISWNGFSSW